MLNPLSPLSPAALCVRETANMGLSPTSPSLSPAPLHHTTPVRARERREESEGGGVLAPLLLLSATPLPSGDQHRSGAGVVMAPGGGGWRRIARHLLLLQAFMAQVGMHTSSPGEVDPEVASTVGRMPHASPLSAPVLAQPCPGNAAGRPRLFALPSVCLFDRK